MLFPLLIAAFLILSGCRMMFSGGKEQPAGQGKEKRRETWKKWERMGRAGFARAQEVHDWRREADSKQYEDASNYSYEEDYDYLLIESIILTAASRVVPSRGTITQTGRNTAGTGGEMRILAVRTQALLLPGVQTATGVVPAPQSVWGRKSTMRGKSSREQSSPV